MVIVGAGPSGLLLSLLLSQHGIPVTVLEGSDKLDDQPRAAYYGPPAMPDLHRAGVLDEVRRRGISPTKMGWRRPEDHSTITLMDTAVLDDVDGLDCRTVCLPLNDLDQLLLERFLERGGEVRWQHMVVAIGQDAGKAWVDCETPSGTVRVEADYIVGCDGANSMVRRGLFGDEYPGFTWDKQIVATNVSLRPSFTLTLRLQPPLLTRGRRCTTTSTSTASQTRTSSFTRITSLCVAPLPQRVCNGNSR